MSDTARCPLCQHVVNQDVEEPAGNELDGAVVLSNAMDGIECGDCGELVRRELVRCWRCGAFMRPEIAARYQEMQQSPSPVIYSQVHAGELDDALLLQHSGRQPATQEDDFVLADGVNMSEGDFEVDGEVAEDAEPPSPDPDEIKLPSAAEDQGGETDGDDSADGSGEPSVDAEEVDEDVQHPIGASGDALLDIAMKEEAESSGRRRRGSATVRRGGARATAKSGFIVFCPNGHPIEVQERHRGKSGKCPKCQSPFHVPAQNWDPGQATDAKSAGIADDKPPEKETLYGTWLDDVHLHQVNPGSLKLKAGSLAGTFDVVDVGLSSDNILLVKLIKGGGLFGGGKAKKASDLREAVREHLDDHQATDGITAADCVILGADVIETLSVVQPAPYAHESMFAGIDVFGEGRIAVRLPQDPDSKTLDFLSFSLSEFRRFSEGLDSRFNLSEFGADVGVPLEDLVTVLTCHYNEETSMTVIDKVSFYENDDAFEVTLVGWKCEACGLIVCEDARKKEKIGGKSGKGLGKAVCPKCKRRFGRNPLHSIRGSGDEVASETGTDVKEDEEQTGALARAREAVAEGLDVSDADEKAGEVDATQESASPGDDES